MTSRNRAVSAQAASPIAIFRVTAAVRWMAATIGDISDLAMTQSDIKRLEP
jgi:hypothetical protein